MFRKLLMVSFIVLFAMSILVAQTVHEVAVGESIDDAVYNAAAGDVIVLTTSGGVYEEPYSVIVDKALTIRSAVGLAEKPVWKANDKAIIDIRDDLVLDGIAFDGFATSDTADHAVMADNGQPKKGYKLQVNNCDMMNFGDAAIYGDSDSTQAELVSITNCFFKNIEARAIEFKDPSDETYGPSCLNFRIENCTLWNIGEDAIYVDAEWESWAETVTFLANHVTLHNPGFEDPDIKGIYPKVIYNAVIKNSIVSSDAEIVGSSARIYGTGSQCLWFLDWNTDDVSLKDDATMDDSTGTYYLENVDPMYTDAANGDFTLLTGSPAIGFGEWGETLGDPKWWPVSEETIHEVAVGESIDDAVYNASAGDVIVLTTSGGLYEEPYSVIVDKALTIRGAEGLAEKPVWKANDKAIIDIRDDLVLDGIAFDGFATSDTADHAVMADNGQPKKGYKLQVNNCDMMNFGDAAIYGDSDSTQAELVSITNCFFKNIEARAIEFKDPSDETYGPSCLNFRIENCTLWNIGEDAIYVDAEWESWAETVTFLANHVTLHNPGFEDPDIKGIYPKVIYNAVIKNSIVSSDAEIVGSSARIYGTGSQCLWFLDWNTDDVSLKDDATMDDSTGTYYLENVDPMYTDAANGDFTLLSGSPAIGFGEWGETLGDPRWWPNNGPVAIDDNNYSNLPVSYKLDQNYPNPFNPTTQIQFELPASALVKLTVYNITGQRVAELVNDYRNAGVYRATLDGANLSSGIYFYMLEAGQFKSVKKMTLLK